MLSLQRDIQCINQPEQTIRFGLNGVKNEFDAIENERSTILCAEFPEEVVGQLTVNNNEVVVFTENSIYLLNLDDCSYTQIIDCVIPNAKYVNAVYHVLQDCNQREVFWVDGVHELRKINIDKPEDCNLNVFKCNHILDIKTKILNYGGFLSTGVYQFAYRYKNGNVAIISDPIYIYDEDISESWSLIDGAIAGTATSKSIEIIINGINTLEEEVELIAISTIGGVISAVIIDKVQAIPIINYTYNGSFKSAMTLNELLVPTISFSVASLICEFQNSLLISGLKQVKNIDYQKYANEIKIDWVTYKIPASLAYKQPDFMNLKTFMGDEVYAFGIVGFFCDGTTTPVFHIPGRIKELGEEIIVPATNPDNFYSCDKEYWEVYNTAKITAQPHESSSFEEDCGNYDFNLRVWERGSMGYNEQCLLYPEIKNCEDEFMYPSGNVRHHRFPDRSLVPHFESQTLPDVECIILEDDKGLSNNTLPYKGDNGEEMYIFPLGIEVNNIEPFEGIYHWEIVYVKRNDLNKTVIAKGNTHKTFYTQLVNGQIAYHPHYNINSSLDFVVGFGDNGSVSAYSEANKMVDFPEDSSVYKFHSPNTSFLKPSLEATHFVVEQEWDGNGRCYGSDDKNILNEDCFVGRFNFNMAAYNNANDLSRPTQVIKQRKITKDSYISAHITSSAFDKPFINLHQESGVAFNLESRLPFLAVCNTEHKDSSLTPFFSLYECALIPCARSLYGSMKRVLCNQYGNLQGLEYKSLIQGNLTTNHEGKYEIKEIFGDSFINYWGYRRTALLHFNQGIFLAAPDDKDELPISCGVHGWYESDVNVDMRHEGVVGIGEIYYPKLGNGFYKLDTLGKQFTIEQSYLGRFHFNNSNNSYINLGIDNYYGYNQDYSVNKDIRSYFAYTDKYKTCDCNSEYLNDIAVSDISNWGTFRINNRIQVPATFGLGTNMFVLSNDLYYHTEDNLWRIFTSQSKLQTDKDTIYIGNGSLFGAVPLTLFAAKEGAAGLQRKHGTLINELGYFFFDDKANIAYNFTEKLVPITEGLSLFFRDLPQSAEWVFGYDPYLKRVLFTKKFENAECSFTLSRLRDTGKWFMFHSYTPTMYLNHRKDMYSINGSSVWLHNRANTYQTFYNNYYPHEIELIETSKGGAVISNSIVYIQDAYIFNTVFNLEQTVNETFTHLFLYNSRQFSGVLSLKPHTDLTTNYYLEATQDLTSTTKVNRKENKWLLNEFDDVVVDYTNPFLIYPCFSPINYEINDSVINMNKPYYNRERFRDFFIGKRFINYRPENPEIKLVTTTFNTLPTTSVR